MTQTGGDSWSAVLNDLARQLPAQVIDTWIRPLQPRGNDDDSIHLEAPSRFHVDYVQDKFGALLRDTIARRLGSTHTIHFTVGPRASGEPRISSGTSPTAPVATAALRSQTAVSDSTVDEYTSALSRAAAPPRPARLRHISTPLNPKYTFETFVVGKSNQFAHAAARAVAEHPATSYNPLFIFGGSGLGKTHIMQAVGNHVRHDSHPNVVLHYASAENFMNEMIGAIQQGRTYEFRNKYRAVDLLLIDDVHFLQGKESTQEEFFHTFNALYDAHKQIVLTSDRPPKEIPTLEERLVSRFEWGLVTDIQPPDLETRIAILRKKAEDDHLEIRDDVLEFIASNVRSNIRELEGSLIRLLAFSSLTDSDIDIALAAEVLKDFLKKPDKVITVESIQKMVADCFDIPEEAMKVKKRTSSLAYPRQIAMFLARQLTNLSLSEIGNRFGGRDHTTVIHACEKIGAASEEDPKLRHTLQRLTSALQG